MLNLLAAFQHHLVAKDSARHPQIGHTAALLVPADFIDARAETLSALAPCRQSSERVEEFGHALHLQRRAEENRKQLALCDCRKEAFLAE